MIYYVDIHREYDSYIVIPHANQGVNKAGSGKSQKDAIANFKNVNKLPPDAGIKVSLVQYSRG